MMRSTIYFALASVLVMAAVNTADVSASTACGSALFDNYTDANFTVGSKAQARSLLASVKSTFKAIKVDYRAAKQNLRKLGRGAKDGATEETTPPTQPSTEPPAPGPTTNPSPGPTGLATANPTGLPTDLPTGLPTANPTGLPTDLPTGLPTGLPTNLPTGLPTDLPTGLPTDLPTIMPSTPPGDVWTDASTSITISDGVSGSNTVATHNGPTAWKGVAGGEQMTSGVHYWEVTLVADQEGYRSVMFGVSRPGLNREINHQSTAWYFYGRNRDLCPGPCGNGNAQGIAVGDRIGMLLDLDAGSLMFYQNGNLYGPGYPSGVTGPVVRTLEMQYAGTGQYNGTVVSLDVAATRPE